MKYNSLKANWKNCFKSIKEVRSIVMKKAHELKKKLSISFSQALKKAWTLIKEKTILKETYDYIVKVKIFNHIEYLGCRSYFDVYLDVKKYLLDSCEEGMFPEHYSKKTIINLLENEEGWIVKSIANVVNHLQKNGKYSLGGEYVYFTLIKNKEVLLSE